MPLILHRVDLNIVKLKQTKSNEYILSEFIFPMSEVNEIIMNKIHELKKNELNKSKNANDKKEKDKYKNSQEKKDQNQPKSATSKKEQNKTQNDKQNNRSQILVYEFFETLLYGNWHIKHRQGSKAIITHYNFYTKNASECAVFLNQNHVELLTCVDIKMSGLRKYFNMKKIQIHEFHPEYEMEENLQKDKYLVLRENKQEIILLFSCHQIRNQFRDNIIELKKFFNTIPNMYDPLILKAFIKADTNQNEEINWQELKQLVRMMKINLTAPIKDFIKKIIKKPQIQKIYFSEFERMWKIFYCRDELTQVFQQYNNQKFATFDDYLNPQLDVKQFRKFLLQQQQQSQQQCSRIIEQIFQNQKTSMSFYNFCLYVMGPSNSLLSQSYMGHQINTSKPLNHYYCYSSHNTYLTGNQLTSSSRAERYLVDLENGIRCVEIDVHDGNDCPIVKHGYTLTSAVTFEDIIKMINKFTIINPKHTPIIISLQIHCNEKNQNLMSKTLKDVFKDKIVQVHLKKQQFPIFEECMGKILIKGPGNFKLFVKNQKLKNSSDNDALSDTCSDDSQEQERDTKFQEQFKKKMPKNFFSDKFIQMRQESELKVRSNQKEKQVFQYYRKLFKKIKKNPTQMLSGLKTQSESLKSLQMNSKYHQKYKVSSHLLKIICILSKAKLQNKQKCHWESLSFGEKKILALYNNKHEREQIVKMSLIKWFRSYPGGMRFDSSNYDPLPALQLGIQIIAVNTQKQDDVNCHILKSFFTKVMNGTTGYRQKPNSLTRDMKSGHDQIQKGDIKQQLVKVEVNFISALRIYQNNNDQTTIPIVCVYAYFTGTSRDKQLNQHLIARRSFTQKIQNNSFNPKFLNSQTIQIKSRDPQLGFLVVQVPQCGRSVIPIDAMKNGWRTIVLCDQQMKEKQSKILCKIKVIKSSSY